jgi:hypothetical protein
VDAPNLKVNITQLSLQLLLSPLLLQHVTVLSFYLLLHLYLVFQLNPAGSCQRFLLPKLIRISHSLLSLNFLIPQDP